MPALSFDGFGGLPSGKCCGGADDGAELFGGDLHKKRQPFGGLPLYFMWFGNTCVTSYDADRRLPGRFRLLRLVTLTFARFPRAKRIMPLPWMSNSVRVFGRRRCCCPADGTKVAGGEIFFSGGRCCGRCDFFLELSTTTEYFVVYLSGKRRIRLWKQAG